MELAELEAQRAKAKKTGVKEGGATTKSHKKQAATGELQAAQGHAGPEAKAATAVLGAKAATAMTKSHNKRMAATAALDSGHFVQNQGPGSPQAGAIPLPCMISDGGL